MRDRTIVVGLCLLIYATTSDELRAFLLPARAVDHRFAGGSVLDGSNDMVDTLLDIFDQHAYMILFVWVLVESLGAPVAGEVVLLLAGSLVAARQLNPVGVIMSAWAGGMLGDALVFRLGQHIGDRSLRRLLGLYCRYTLCSSECFVRTKDCFLRFSAWTIVFARFAVGVRAMTPPLSGMLGYSYHRFALFDAIGILIWASAFLLVGVFLGHQWKHISEPMPYVSAILLTVSLSAIAGVMLWKFVRRRRFGPPALETDTAVLDRRAMPSRPGE